MATKICSHCGVEKQVEEFGVLTRNEDGRREICKACFNKKRSTPEEKQKRRIHNLDPEFKNRRNERDRKYRRIHGVKERETQYRTPEEIKQRQKDYYNQPKWVEYRREYQKEYLKNPLNKARQKESVKKRNQNPEVKARNREYAKEYMKTPKMRAYRKEYNRRQDIKKRKLEVYEKTPEWKAAHCKAVSKRRAKIKDLEYSLTFKQWEKIIELQGNKCNICGKKFTKKDPATRDHIIPASKRGPYTRENIQAVHKDCNSKKKDKIDKSNIVVWISEEVALTETP